MYDHDDSIKVNDVVEVVGVLSRLPELAVRHLQGGGRDMADGGGADFPSDDFTAPTSLVRVAPAPRRCLGGSNATQRFASTTLRPSVLSRECWVACGNAGDLAW